MRMYGKKRRRKFSSDKNGKKGDVEEGKGEKSRTRVEL